MPSFILLFYYSTQYYWFRNIIIIRALGKCLLKYWCKKNLRARSIEEDSRRINSVCSFNDSIEPIYEHLLTRVKAITRFTTIVMLTRVALADMLVDLMWIVQSSRIEATYTGSLPTGWFRSEKVALRSLLGERVASRPHHSSYLFAFDQSQIRPISRPIRLKRVRGGRSAGNIMSIRWGGFHRVARDIGTPAGALLDADDTWAMAIHSWPLINHIISYHLFRKRATRDSAYYFARCEFPRMRVRNKYMILCTWSRGYNNVSSRLESGVRALLMMLPFLRRSQVYNMRVLRKTCFEI